MHIHSRTLTHTPTLACPKHGNLDTMAEQNEINYKAAAAEFIAMMFFVYVGCGSATSNAGNDGWVLLVALSFGMGTMVQLSFDHLNSS